MFRFLALLILFAPLKVQAKIFNIPTFGATVKLEGEVTKKVTAFLHVFCTFDGRQVCNVEDPDYNMIVVGSLDESGLLNFPEFNFDLQRPPNCFFLVSNCKPFMNVNIYFTQYEFNQELIDRILNFEYSYSPFKPKGHTVLNAGHYSLNRSKFSRSDQVEENILYFINEYLPYVRLYELSDGSVGYEYTGTSEF